MPAVAIYCVLRGFSDGLGKTRPSMVLGLIALALNIPLNYIFIYGHFGVPAMGGVGCGWATAIVMWFMALGMVVWTMRGAIYQSSQVYSHFEWPKWPILKRLLSVGLPIGIAVFAESSIFAVIALLIGGLDALGLLADKLDLHGGLWAIVERLNDNMGSVGYAAVAIFLVFWGISALNYRRKGYDNLAV